MARTTEGRREREASALRSDLAGIAVAMELIRVERALARKYRSEQPRAPAGGPDGGRWVVEGSVGPDPDVTGSIGGDGAADTRTDEVVTADGSRVLSIRIRADRNADWDERHTVTAPDGTTTVFETSGLTQTVRDGETGEILGRSALTADGAEPEAVIQPARGLSSGAAERARRTLEAAGALFSALSSRNSQDRTAVFAAPASEYVPGDAIDASVVFVGAVGPDELDRICPRHPEVQAIADSVAAGVRAAGDYSDARAFGNIVHSGIAKSINAQGDPSFKAETSYEPSTGAIADYGTKGSIRLDVLERSSTTTVCVYDHKTGDATLKTRRAVDIANVVRKQFPDATGLIMIEIRPK